MSNFKFLYFCFFIIVLSSIHCRKGEIDNKEFLKGAFQDTFTKRDTLNKKDSFSLTDTPTNKKHQPSTGKIFESLSTNEKIVALTFDACEYKKPSYFDTTILNYLLREKIPATIFISGRFARRNKNLLQEISKYDFFEIENHTLNHYQHTELLSNEEIENEVLENEKLILEITGKRTKYFRFPGGNYNENAIKILQSLGYLIIHWTFVSGDYNKKMSPQMLFKRVEENIKPGSILIFHINGRGYSTGKALPEIVNYLKRNNYKLIKLEDIFD